MLGTAITMNEEIILSRAEFLIMSIFKPLH